jgi:hypothetical protein
MRRIVCFAAVACAAAALAGPAAAWGVTGHKVTALIAYKRLTPEARAKVDALLKADRSPLTAFDFASRATWADAYRADRRTGSDWHAVDIELDGPDLDAACHGRPALPAGKVASEGPAEACVVDKIDQFARELADPATSADERKMAFRYLIHLVGDIHQPLHAADNHDRGGNCVEVDIKQIAGLTNLHAYWDTTTVSYMGATPEEIAAKLDAAVSPEQEKAWAAGDAKAWALESYDIAKTVAYDLPERPTCSNAGKIKLSDEYQNRAVQTSAGQLLKAGVRLAYVLNEALK